MSNANASARPASPRGKVVIDSPSVFAQKRRLALITIWVPTLGTAAALALAVWQGVTWIEVGLLVGMYTVTLFGVEVGFHRAFAHRAFRCGPAMQAVLAVCGSMSAQGGVLSWAATHRRHHRHSDTPDDAHSPHARRIDGKPVKLGLWRGFWHSQIGHLYSDHVTNSALFCKDVLGNRTLMAINARYRTWVLLGLAIPTVAGGLLHQSLYGAFLGFLWGGLVRVFVAHHCYFTNGSLSHMFGYVPFVTRDKSANNLLCAIPTFGSALQNNHHAFPAAAKIGIHFWEIDIAGYIVNGLELMGLIYDVKRITPPMMRAAKSRLLIDDFVPAKNLGTQITKSD